MNTNMSNETLKWDANLEKTLKSALLFQSTKSTLPYLSVLQKVFETVKTPLFYYADHRKHVQGCKALLAVWKHLLEINKMLPLPERKAAMQIIVNIMKRSEFDPVHFKHLKNNFVFGTSSKSSKGKPKNILNSISKKISGSKSLQKEETKIYLTYKHLLYSTQRFVIEGLIENRKKKGGYTELFTFFASVLSINTFRLTNAFDVDIYSHFVEIMCKHWKKHFEDRKQFFCQEESSLKTPDENLETPFTLCFQSKSEQKFFTFCLKTLKTETNCLDFVDLNEEKLKEIEEDEKEEKKKKKKKDKSKHKHLKNEQENPASKEEEQTEDSESQNVDKEKQVLDVSHLEKLKIEKKSHRKKSKSTSNESKSAEGEADSERGSSETERIQTDSSETTSPKMLRRKHFCIKFASYFKERDSASSKPEENPAQTEEKDKGAKLKPKEFDQLTFFIQENSFLRQLFRNYFFLHVTKQPPSPYMDHNLEKYPESLNNDTKQKNEPFGENYRKRSPAMHMFLGSSASSSSGACCFNTKGSTLFEPAATGPSFLSPISKTNKLLSQQRNSARITTDPLIIQQVDASSLSAPASPTPTSSNAEPGSPIAEPKKKDPKSQTNKKTPPVQPIQITGIMSPQPFSASGTSIPEVNLENKPMPTTPFPGPKFFPNFSTPTKQPSMKSMFSPPNSSIIQNSNAALSGSPTLKPTFKQDDSPIQAEDIFSTSAPPDISYIRNYMPATNPNNNPFGVALDKKNKMELELHALQLWHEESLKTCEDWLPYYFESTEFFNVFFAEFVSQVHQIMSTDLDLTYKWGIVPGYNLFLMTYMFKMKQLLAYAVVESRPKYLNKALFQVSSDLRRTSIGKNAAQAPPGGKSSNSERTSPTEKVPPLSPSFANSSGTIKEFPIREDREGIPASAPTMLTSPLDKSASSPNLLAIPYRLGPAPENSPTSPKSAARVMMKLHKKMEEGPDSSKDQPPDVSVLSSSAPSARSLIKSLSPENMDPPSLSLEPSSPQAENPPPSLKVQTVPQKNTNSPPNFGEESIPTNKNMSKTVESLDGQVPNSFSPRRMSRRSFFAQSLRPIEKKIQEKEKLEREFQTDIDEFDPLEEQKTILMIDHKKNKGIRQWLAASFVILRNRQFINVLMAMFFPLTNVFDVDSCFHTLEVFDSWFCELQIIAKLETIKTETNILPKNFNVQLLIKALGVLLSSEHFQLLIRTLIFIYNIIDLFDGMRRVKFVYDFLLKGWFFKLFLHWNDDTRKCFHRILIYKVRRFRAQNTVSLISQYRSPGFILGNPDDSAIHAHLKKINLAYPPIESGTQQRCSNANTGSALSQQIQQRNENSSNLKKNKPVGLALDPLLIPNSGEFSENSSSSEFEINETMPTPMRKTSSPVPLTGKQSRTLKKLFSMASSNSLLSPSKKKGNSKSESSKASIDESPDYDELGTNVHSNAQSDKEGSGPNSAGSITSALATNLQNLGNLDDAKNIFKNLEHNITTDDLSPPDNNTSADDKSPLFIPKIVPDSKSENSSPLPNSGLDALSRSLESTGSHIFANFSTKLLPKEDSDIDNSFPKFFNHRPQNSVKKQEILMNDMFDDKTEEATDTVLKSKADSFIQIVRITPTTIPLGEFEEKKLLLRKMKFGKQKDEFASQNSTTSVISEHVSIPQQLTIDHSLRPYISKATAEYQAIQQEYEQWKTKVESTYAKFITRKQTMRKTWSMVHPKWAAILNTQPEGAIGKPADEKDDKKTMSPRKAAEKNAQQWMYYQYQSMVDWKNEEFVVPYPLIRFPKFTLKSE